jgi:hypothetical protein
MRTAARRFLLATLFAVILSPTAFCREPVERVQPLPEGDQGIAARYPGDDGIESDEMVLFAEDFEEGSLEEILKRWTDVYNKDGEALRLSDVVPDESAGKTSIEMTATRGKNTGGHLWKLLDAGVDTMYMRVYVRFGGEHPYVHHFIKMGAWRDSPRWPQGEAGYRHDGTKSFQTGLEPMSGYGRFAPPGAWHLYTYWCGMKSYEGPKGTRFYGNSFAPAEPAQVPRGEWQCVEMMIRANSAPERRDGEQAFWIDGKLVGRWAPGTVRGRWHGDNYIIDEKGEPFEGFRWRLRDDVKLNTVWLLYYMASVFEGDSQFDVPEGTPHNADVAKVWFDDLVVATGYIGPVKAPADGPGE